MTGLAVALVFLVLAPATGSSVQDQLEALGEESLRCTGCEMIADALYASLDSKIAKSFKGWNTDERVANVGKAMRKACKRVKEDQVAIVGEQGERKFGSFQKLMSQGGTLSNLSMGPESAKALHSICIDFLKAHLEELVGRMSKVKRMRVLDFQLKGAMCQEMLPACAAAHNDDDDDDSDERDEL